MATIRTIHVSKEGLEEAEAALKRSVLQENPLAENRVREIIAQVREQGDAALLKLGKQFDSPYMERLEVPEEEFQAADRDIAPELKDAMKRAAANITAFHERQRRTSWLEAEPNRITGQIVRPLERVGLYVPGGTASYPSTVLMTALPAKAAGAPNIFLCSPAQKNGKVNPAVLYAARMAGVKRVFAAGGAQAIAAMAYGTEAIPAVDKIVGPGNIYVNIAKKLLWGVVDIDMLAGPSEVCVVADEEANPCFAAMDMLTQAEHDTESAAYLITPSAELASAVANEIERALIGLPRQAILRQALYEHGAIIVTDSMDQALELANVCAPEHLALMIRDPFSALGRIRNAGAVLMGDYTPQTLGDYLAGPSHTLPTSGTARFSSPLHLDTFLKKTSFIYYNRTSLEEESDRLTAFARAEGFETHAAAVEIRREVK